MSYRKAGWSAVTTYAAENEHVVRPQLEFCRDEYHGEALSETASAYTVLVEYFFWSQEQADGFRHAAFTLMPSLIRSVHIEPWVGDAWPEEELA